jgi:hypothetical protein
MGKLGGGELNFSSDIDLIFAWPEHGATRGGRRELDRLRLTLGVAGRSPLLTAGGIQPVASGDNQGLCQDRLL